MTATAELLIAKNADIEAKDGVSQFFMEISLGEGGGRATRPPLELPLGHAPTELGITRAETGRSSAVLERSIIRVGTCSECACSVEACDVVLNVCLPLRLGGRGQLAWCLRVFSVSFCFHVTVCGPTLFLCYVGSRTTARRCYMHASIKWQPRQSC